ncbi:hypothetical protein CaCOL14_008166 [Colletotrichum acutatum]
MGTYQDTNTTALPKHPFKGGHHLLLLPASCLHVLSTSSSMKTWRTPYFTISSHLIFYTLDSQPDARNTEIRYGYQRLHLEHLPGQLVQDWVPAKPGR